MGDVPFKDLPLKDIIHYLQECGLYGIAEDDIRKPQPDQAVLQNLYRWFIIQITQCGERSLDQPPFNPKGEPLDPDLYTVGQQKMMIVLSVEALFRDLFDASHYSLQFTMRDLTHPQPKKTIRNLSLLIQFHKTIQERQEAVETIMDKYMGRLEEKRAILQNMDDLKNDINRIRAEKARNQPKIAQLLEERKRAKAEMEQLLKEIETVKNENEHLENKHNSELGALKELETEVQHLRDKERSLDEQIIASPEKVQSRMAEMEGEEGAAKARLEDVHISLDGLRVRGEELGAIATALDSLMADMKIIQVEKEEGDVLLGKREKVEEEIEEMKQRLEDEHLAKEEKKKVLEAKGEQLEGAKRSHTTRMADMEREIKEIERKLMETEEKREREEMAEDDLEEKCRKIRDQIHNQKVEYQGHSDRLEKKYQDLVAAMEKSDEQAEEFFKKTLRKLKGEGEETTEGEEEESSHPPEDPLEDPSSEGSHLQE